MLLIIFTILFIIGIFAILRFIVGCLFRLIALIILIAVAVAAFSLVGRAQAIPNPPAYRLQTGQTASII